MNKSFGSNFPIMLLVIRHHMVHSIHPSFTTYLCSGHMGSSLSREAQTPTMLGLDTKTTWFCLGTNN